MSSPLPARRHDLSIDSPWTSQGRSEGEARFVAHDRTRTYMRPVEVVTAHEIDEVGPALERVERRVEAGLHAAGFVAYEAAPAFDSALIAHPPSEQPLVWFGLYEACSIEPGGTAPSASAGPKSWDPLIAEDEYYAAFAEIKRLIEAGDTYQVNLTFPMCAHFDGDPREWFQSLCSAQQSEYSAYLDTGRTKILSASPELFFRLEGDTLTMRPMKGTRPRGLWYEDDCAKAEELLQSEKDRAENIMIVDLLRNDMGRISEVGSVRVDERFSVERFPTVWQMTSTISSSTHAGMPEIFKALFPSGSVTGAPKVRTMEIINALEPHPRGVYCGAVGWWAPNRQAEFNVAIRTLTLDARTNEATYHVGSGLTWDSQPRGEYEECWTKADFLSRPMPEFELLESLLWDGGAYFLLDEHLERLENSARYFQYEFDLGRVRLLLDEKTDTLPAVPTKVRLCIERTGKLSFEAQPVAPSKQLRLGFAPEPVDRMNPFLYHKTTNRQVYDASRRSRPELDDVLLWNDRGEITESTIANVAIERDGQWFTPPVSSGLLPGIMRARLLNSGDLTEAVLTKDDVRRAGRIQLINSVRKRIDVAFVD